MRAERIASLFRATPSWCVALLVLVLLALPAGAQTPNDPLAPTVDNTTTTSITFSWTPVSGATGYEYQQVVPRYTDPVAVGPGVTQATFSGLNPATDYGFQVLSIVNGQKSDWSSVPFVYTNPLPASNLRTTCVSGSVVELAWDPAPPSSNLLSYELSIDNPTSWQSRFQSTARSVSNLTSGTFYTFYVRSVVTNHNGDFPSFGHPISLSVTTAAAQVEPPTNLQTSEIGQSSVKLTWTASSTSSVTYEVSVDGSTWTDSGSDLQHVFSGLSAETSYSFRVRTKSGSNTSCAAIAPPAQTLPASPLAPAGLQTSGITQNAITLTWVKPPNATFYKVRKDSGDSWTVLGDVATYTFRNLSADTEYTLQVAASNSGGDSDPPAATTVRTLPNAPAGPTGLSASGITQSAITLSWTKSSGATGYKVQVDNGAVATLGDVATHSFSGLSAGTSYTLKVVAFNSGGDSSAASVSASTLPNAPAAPTGLSAPAAGITDTSITLNWTKSSGATAYKVQVDSGAVTTLGDVATHSFSGLSAGTSYTLKVIASNSGGDSAAATLTVWTKPAAPTGLSALPAGITDTSITLTWTKSTGATGYKVQVDSGTVATLGDVASHTFSGLSAGASYTLKVIAFNSSGDSATATATVLTEPAAPASLSAPVAGITDSGFTVNWTKSTGATGYKVQLDSGAVTSLGDVATHIFSSLSSGTSYVVKVFAFNGSGDSDASTATVLTKPAVPTGLTASGHTQSAITLSWTKSTGATGYKVQVGNGAVTTLGDVASYTFSGLSAGSSHTLKVIAFNASGDSSAASTSASTLAASPGALAGPTAPSAASTQNSITLSWTKSSDTTVTSYEVQGGGHSAWHDVGNVASYTFSSLNSGTQYTLQVRAKKGTTTSALVSLSPWTRPADPTSPQASGQTQSAITLGWTKSTGATGYKVELDDALVATLGDVNTYEFTGLSAGTSYKLGVKAFNSGGDSGAATVNASTLAPGGALAAPTNLTATGIILDSITLGWTKSTGATAYKVRKNGDSAWTTLGDVDSYVFTGLSTNTSYTLEVKASNSGGDSSAASISATTLTRLPETLLTPTNLRAVDITQTSLTLTWTKVNGATGYSVRAYESGSPNVISIGNVASHAFSGLRPGTQYYLDVYARHTNVFSNRAFIRVSTLAAVPTAPATPTGFARIGRTGTTYSVEWNESTGATAYKVQVDNGATTTLASSARTYTFTGLSAGASYTFKVIASNSVGDSEAATITDSTATVPAAPTGLSAPVEYITDTSIRLDWTLSSGAIGYKVQANTGAVRSLGSHANTFAFTGLSAGSSYTLKVIAYSSAGDSPAATLTVWTEPAAPTGLSAPATGVSDTSIRLNWTKSTGATAYKVQVDSGSVTTLGDVATHTFTGLSAGTSYTLKVIAGNSGGDSTAAALTVWTEPVAPTGLSAPVAGITDTSIRLNWTKSAGATGYKAQANNDAVTTLGDVATHTFTGLSAGSSHSLKVIAFNVSGDSEAATLSVLTEPAKPTGLTTSGPTQSAITLSWTKSTGATGYKVQVNNDAAITLGDVATHTFSSLTAGASYTLKVMAFNASGDSEPASVSASTLAASPSALAGPTSVAASSTQNSITLTWTKSSDSSVAAYQVKRAAQSNWQDLGDVATYTFSSLDPGVQYTLQVRAKKGQTTSTTVSVSHWTRPADPTSPQASGPTQSAITLSWTKSTGATAYKVQVDSVTVATLGDVNTYEFTGLSAGAQYTLGVIASNSGGDSGAATVSARTQAATPSALAGPTNVTVPDNGISQNSIIITWTKSSDTTVSSYEVQGGTHSNWRDVGNVATYTFTGLSADTQYTLQLRAKKGQMTSTAVSISRRTLPNPPAMPAGAQAGGATVSSITLSWTQASDASSYEVRGGAHSDWHDVGNVGSYTFTGLDPGTSYKLEVRAKNTGGESEIAFDTASTQPQSSLDSVGSRDSVLPDNPDPDPPSVDSGSSDTDDDRDSDSDSDTDSGSGGDSGDDQAPDGAPAEAPKPLVPAFNCSAAQKALIVVSTLRTGVNLQCLGPDGIFQSDLVARGVVMGVDVWGWVRGTVDVCFRQPGDVVFLDAAFSPRQQANVLLYLFDGMTCAQLDRAGTLVLLRTRTTTPGPAPASIQAPAPALAQQSSQPVAEPATAAFKDCMVRATHYVNFRETPGGTLIFTLVPGVTLTAFSKQGDWYNVDFYGRRGWLHGDYATPIGDCG